jgi:hypothetical protein
MRYIIVAILAALVGGGIEFERSTYDIKAASDLAYGCGRHDALANPNSPSYDPAEYDMPPCDAIRRAWLWGERWPK